MEISSTFQEYLAQPTQQITILRFIVNLLLCGMFAVVLKHIYIKYGNTISNRKLFGRNFTILAMTTMLVITIVKSSLALSLGLVGALSIIRFRAAIKEPEELGYLFLAISIGLGFGANQGSITFIALIIILLVIVLSKIRSKESNEDNNLNLTVMSENPKDVILENIVKILKTHCTEVKMKRLDESDKIFEATFDVQFESYENLVKSKKEIRRLSGKAKVTYLDSVNIY